MESDKKVTPSWKLYNRPWYQKLGLAVWNYIKNVGLLLWSVIKAIPRKIWSFIRAVGGCFAGLWFRFVKGDWRTKISYLIMGFGCFSRSPKQFLKGFLLLAVEAIFIVFMIFLGAPNLALFGSLGTVAKVTVTEGGFETSKYVHNSLSILIFSVLSIILMLFFLYMWILNTKIAYKTQQLVKDGKPLTGIKQQFNYAMNDGYHTTVLALPILGVLLITVLPLTCNILVAFTNYGRVDGVNYYPPASLFDWVGFDAFAHVFGATYGSIIWRVLGWTLIWAFFATFTNFFFGMFLAMMINKKTIRLKAVWRTCFIIVIAVPDFVTLLMMSKFFGYSSNDGLTGAFNQILIKLFCMKNSIDWLGGNYHLARAMVIIINMWRGMPYTMLATSGILMNIPAELYESSRIDGAGPVRRFISITFPYIMFVMGPQLITTFTGNINNFNVIFFLTGGGPNILMDGGGSLRTTDLLVTWLYSLTVGRPNPEYNYGAVIGIFTFIITSVFALIVFNSSKSIKQEDSFQ